MSEAHHPAGGGFDDLVDGAMLNSGALLSAKAAEAEVEAGWESDNRWAHAGLVEVVAGLSLEDRVSEVRRRLEGYAPSPARQVLCRTYGWITDSSTATRRMQPNIRAAHGQVVMLTPEYQGIEGIPGNIDYATPARKVGFFNVLGLVIQDDDNLYHYLLTGQDPASYMEHAESIYGLLTGGRYESAADFRNVETWRLGSGSRSRCLSEEDRAEIEAFYVEQIAGLTAPIVGSGSQAEVLHGLISNSSRLGSRLLHLLPWNQPEAQMTVRECFEQFLVTDPTVERWLRNAGGGRR